MTEQARRAGRRAAPREVGANASGQRSGRPTPLPRSPLLANVAAEDLRALVRSGRRCRFSARQVLFHRDDAPTGLYVIVTGRVRVVIQEPSGAELTLATFGAGEVLGELSVLDGTPRSATAVAASAVEALYVAADDVRGWLMARPAAMWQLLTGLAGRMRSTDEQIAEIALLPIQTRIARRLWQKATDAAGGEPGPGLRLRLNQVAWAATLGATRESINRQLARLRSDGVIRREGQDLVLLLPEALRRAANVP